MDTCGSSSRCSRTYFQAQVKNCLDYAKAKKGNGAYIVGIMCEYTPREIIMASGAVPVCLCAGSREMIDPAEKVLPSNLCPLIKSTFGYSLQEANPFLEMADLIVAETTCDGKKKMYELMAEKRPMYVLELPQKPNDQDSFERWVIELAKFKVFLEKRFSIAITDERLKDAILIMNQERMFKRELAGLMKQENPPLTGRELLDMKSLISGMPLDFEYYKEALDMLSGRARKPPEAPRIRVLLTGVPLPHGAERVIDIIESNAGLVVCQENCSGLKPIEEDIPADASSPMRAIAEKYYHLPCSVMTPNTARINNLRRLAKEYQAQCVIELVWQACITYDVESSFVKKLAENELGLPYLGIETDYSPFDSMRIGMRVQALFETIKDRGELVV